MQKFQEEYAERVINGMTRLVKVRARMVMDLEKKTSHVGRRHKLFVSTKKGSRDICRERHDNGRW